MKTQLRLVCVLFAAWTATIAVRAAGENPAPAPAPAPGSAAPAVSPAPVPVQTELKQVIDKINAKIQANTNVTEQDLADDLKGFDTILATHKGEQTDEVAQVLLMKAMLYVDVLNNLDKAEDLFKQLKTDFPNTIQGKQVDVFLSMLEKQREATKLENSFVPGVALPDFNEKGLTGEPLSIAKYKGKIVLVNFWATWCSPCMDALPNIIDAYKKYHDKGLEIIGINLDKDADELKKFLEEKGMTWQQFFDGQGWENKLVLKYGVTSLPMSYLLDREGKIIAKRLTAETLAAELGKQFAK